MAEHWTCPRGHQWAYPAEPAGPTEVCPICGVGPITPPPPHGFAKTLVERGRAGPQHTEAHGPSADGTDPAPIGAPSSAPLTPAVPQPAGRFRKLRRHAKGGLGKVSIALDEDLQREVALKEIRARFADDPENQTRFVTEAMITGRLEHPGIVPVYGLGRDPHGRPYYAMKFVHGLTLHDAIRDYHAVPTLLEFRMLLQRFIDVCQAVAYAHKQGVIHRDLKPANVMLGEFGETLVLDWGLAKCLGESIGESMPETEKGRMGDGSSVAPSSPPSHPPSFPPSPSLTQAGQIMGTPAYMSPEQAGGELTRVGPASDIYSLGAMLYELLSGRPPYDELTTVDLIRNKRNEPPPAPSRIKQGIPRALEAICLKAMARETAARYATARALAQEIEQWLADEAVGAYREPLWGRAARWVRRHKPLVAGLAVLLVAAVIALGVSNFLVRNEQKQTEHERNEARQRFQLANATLDQILGHLGQNRQALVSHMDLRSDPITAGVLQQVRGFYENFTKSDKDDRGTLLEKAMAYRRIADICRLQGEPRAADDAYAQALALLEGLRSGDMPEDAYRSQLASTHHDRALHLHMTDRMPAAASAYQLALELQERLLADSGAREQQDGRRLELARTRHNLGLLFRDTGKLQEAKAELLRAIELRTAVSVHPRSMNLDTRRAIAQAQIDLSDLLLMLNEPTEAEGRSRAAVELLNAVIADMVDTGHTLQVPECRHELAGSYNNLGLVLTRTNPSDAEAAFRTALEAREKLLRDYPTRPDYRYELALCRVNRGVLHFLGGRREPADLEWNLARQELERLVRDFPERPLYVSRLGQTLNNLAAVCDQRNDLVAAQRLLVEALEHQRKAYRINPKHPEYRSKLQDTLLGLADVQLRRLDLRGAVATGEELTALTPRDAELARRAAGLYARCVGLANADQTLPSEERRKVAAQYLDRAWTLLREAVQGGYKEFRDLRTANDLSTLRERQEFEQFIQDAEKHQLRRPDPAKKP